MHAGFHRKISRKNQRTSANQIRANQREKTSFLQKAEKSAFEGMQFPAEIAD